MINVIKTKREKYIYVYKLPESRQKHLQEGVMSDSDSACT